MKVHSALFARLATLVLTPSLTACGLGSNDVSGQPTESSIRDQSPTSGLNGPDGVPTAPDEDDDITVPTQPPSVADSDATESGDPATCAAAAEHRTYVGCEFWPTITYNPLYEEFDFAVVLANGGQEDAEIVVSGGALLEPITATVAKGQLQAVVLPWVPELKGPEFSRWNTSEGRASASVRATGGAYKVTTSRPVSAWQFNPLQFKKSGIENCSGSSFGTTDCFSVSNDASLLIPTTAMTRNYRVFSRSGKETGAWGDAAGGMAITATEDDTTVDIQLSEKCASEAAPGVSSGNCVAPGPGVESATSGEVVTYHLNAGDVLSLLGDRGQGDQLSHADISGSLVQASSPVQVIAFNPITNIPDPSHGNADHIEELVLPAEALGARYLVNPPSNPTGIVRGGHMVRIYGSVDATMLSYAGTPPNGAPTRIDAADVVEIGPVTEGFEITGTAPFAVGSFMLGGSAQSSDPNCPGYPCSGDPAFSMMVSPQQFRASYTFLAPTDYDANFADVLVPDGALVLLDGELLMPTEAVAPGWKVARAPLSPNTGGVHRLEADVPVGLQVTGFGHATSYYYPGGLDLNWISEPPPPVVVR